MELILICLFVILSFAIAIASILMRSLVFKLVAAMLFFVAGIGIITGVSYGVPLTYTTYDYETVGVASCTYGNTTAEFENVTYITNTTSCGTQYMLSALSSNATTTYDYVLYQNDITAGLGIMFIVLTIAFIVIAALSATGDKENEEL